MPPLFCHSQVMNLILSWHICLWISLLPSNSWKKCLKMFTSCLSYCNFFVRSKPCLWIWFWILSVFDSLVQTKTFYSEWGRNFQVHQNQIRLNILHRFHDVIFPSDSKLSLAVLCLKILIFHEHSTFYEYDFFLKHVMV